jgi:hypothetical protein
VVPVNFLAATAKVLAIGRFATVDTDCAGSAIAGKWSGIGEAYLVKVFELYFHIPAGGKTKFLRAGCLEDFIKTTVGQVQVNITPGSAFTLVLVYRRHTAFVLDLR